MNANEDCCFLLYFIMGTYFGPDLKGEKTQKSALQRIAEDLPPYTLNQLADSHIRTSEIEQIYYYLVRKADRSLIVKLPVLLQFIQGNHPSEGEDFLTLFPSHLHPQTESLNHSRIVASVAFIRNPAIFYIKQEDIERFKKLTGLEELFIENTVVRLPNGIYLEKGDDDDSEEEPIGSYFRECKSPKRKRRLEEILETENLKSPQSLQLALPPSGVRDGPGIVILPSQPSREELRRIVEIARNSYAVTGSAAKGQVGSVIGLMDISESEDSYLFRVALPGVKRENRAFQCEVDSDGRVVIKGETITGEKRVYRFSQTFIMQTQNLCPTGPFSVSFQLPGPVDPQRFKGSFGSDAILEGVVMKQMPSTRLIKFGGEQ
ncbi:increased DNA methylation 2-like [Chenopodium quinoa]|uniref:increased DNA methylation 2-like n=1 Tax=Chenopodium quinoa TaxID=63459 RepID=UPI000B771744|nr:increased DNA methylation 2-like [Chenopodium quinoa]XP_021742422.1 increased DNA methylation 2-like [Chenopodium quinoa]